MSNQCNPTLMCCSVDRKEAIAISSRVENCGACCLIHQQFTLTENITTIELTRIYMAPDFLFSPESPFGTVAVSNCGGTPITVFFKTASGTNPIVVVVPPKGQLAVTGAIKQIDVAGLTNNPTPICAVFSFDLFLTLPQCSAPDDVDINIDNNIGSASSTSQSSSASSSQAASAASVSGDSSTSQTSTTTSS